MNEVAQFLLELMACEVYSLKQTIAEQNREITERTRRTIGGEGDTTDTSIDAAEPRDGDVGLR